MPSDDVTLEQIHSSSWNAPSFESTTTESEAEALFVQWRNISNYTDSQLVFYIEKYLLNQFYLLRAKQAEGGVSIAFALLGMVGNILEAVVLRRQEFHRPSYLYHRSLVYIEVFAMVALTVIGVSQVTPAELQTLEQAFLTNNIASVIRKVTLMFADYVTVFICVERCVALWLPLHFKTVNQWSVAAGAVALSGAFGLTYAPDFWKYDVWLTSKSIPKVQKSAFYSTPQYEAFVTFRDILELLKGVLVICLTMAVVLGLARRAGEIKPSGSAPGGRARGSRSQKSMQMSLLCLSCAVPVTINSVLYVLQSQYLSRAVIGAPAVSRLNLERSLVEVDHVFFGKCVNGFFVNLSYCLAHCCHFYFYVLLNEAIRKATLETFCKTKQRHLSQVPTTAAVELQPDKGS